MEITAIKTDFPVHYSYLIIDGEEAAVVDPGHDIGIYLDKVRARNAHIKYVFETLRSEKQMAASRQFKKDTMAQVIHGNGLDFYFCEFAAEGDTFSVGETTLKVLETPGYTPEAISIAIYSGQNIETPVGVFTGDVLLSDDFDSRLFEGERELYASLLYDSIHEKLLPLGDQVVVFPAHGTNAFCEGEISGRDITTLGYEKLHNPQMLLTREDFIRKKSRVKLLSAG